MSIREIIRETSLYQYNRAKQGADFNEEEVDEVLFNLSAELLKDCPKDKDLKTDGMIELVKRDNAFESKGFIEGFNQANKQWREHLQKKMKRNAERYSVER